MSAPHPTGPDGEGRRAPSLRRLDPAAGSPEQEALAQALRSVIDRSIGLAAPPEVLRELADRLRGIADDMDPSSGSGQWEAIAQLAGSDALPYPYNPVIGRASAMAPPVELHEVDGAVEGTMTCGSAYEGPPGYVHGGFVSMVLDQALGTANVVGGHPGMTVHLGVRYHRPTPLHVPLTVAARLDRSEGRKAFSTGEILHDGQVTASCEGVFVTIDPAKGRQLFGNRPTPGRRPEQG